MQAKFRGIPSKFASPPDKDHKFGCALVGGQNSLLAPGLATWNSTPSSHVAPAEQRVDMFLRWLRVSGLSAMLLSMGACSSQSERPVREQPPGGSVMLILRGVANSENPHGLLDDRAALEYARRLGFRGEVLDVAGNPGANSAQVQLARERIREDQSIKAIYGFSGGGYNARLIWAQLNTSERDRIRKVIVVGSPGVQESDFIGDSDVVIKPDPPEGHMAGPRALLESLRTESSLQ
jgi:hypothetical protein